eukprot:746681-Hanusia_phi.AAC.4
MPGSGKKLPAVPKHALGIRDPLLNPHLVMLESSDGSTQASSSQSWDTPGQSWLQGFPCDSAC